MKKHIFRVFLLVLLVIPLYLSCVPNRSPLAPPAIQTPTPSISTLVALAAIPTYTPAHIPTIYPSPTSNRDELINEVNALNRLGYYDIAIREANFYTDYELTEFTYAELCLEGALHNKAAEVLSFCDLAVQNYPNNEQMLYARGIARSVTGDYEGAISDLTIFLEAVDKNRDKKYSSKPFRFNKDIYLYEHKFFEWIEILQSGQNPFTYTVTSDLPTFVITDIATSDYDYILMTDELKALIKYKQYEKAMDVLSNYYRGDFPPKGADDDPSEAEVRQQGYLLVSFVIPSTGFSMVCIHGCLAGDIDQVDLYCEYFDKMYQSVPEIFGSENDYQPEKKDTISHGIYLVYRGDYEAAKTYFEEYLAWEQSMEDHRYAWYIYESSLENWISKLENNQFPFSREDVYSLQNHFPWN